MTKELNKKLELARKTRPYVDFSGADLSGHDFSNGKYARANFSGANLKGADLSHGDFSGANFKDANLDGITLNDTYLNACDLSGANVSGWNCLNTQGFHVRGIVMDMQTVDVKSITGPHDCHELVVAMLLKEFPGDMDIQMISECIIARFISCWHGLVERVRQCYPDRFQDLTNVFQKYPHWQLPERWQLGIAMADCVTIEDWEALRGTIHEQRFPALVRGWIQRTKRERGLI